jgi:hypothetical protein
MLSFETAAVESPLIWPEEVLVALHTLADLIEYYHVGLTGRPEPKFSKFLQSGDAFKLESAAVLEERVSFWLVHVEKWLQTRGKKDRVEVVHVADNCVRVLRAAKF